MASWPPRTKWLPGNHIKCIPWRVPREIETKNPRKQMSYTICAILRNYAPGLVDDWTFGTWDLWDRQGSLGSPAPIPLEDSPTPGSLDIGTLGRLDDHARLVPWEPGPWDLSLWKPPKPTYTARGGPCLFLFRFSPDKKRSIQQHQGVAPSFINNA